ncbi:MAG TPA: GNAT family N-acetyltransferase [Rhodopila sp.]|jgi:GNAT superfamily N-acetyltransferase|nr:GNAT family N-acetyltransferase [Rhodopila sp.]
MLFAPSESAEQGTFEAIFHALDADSRDKIGPAKPRLLVIPIRDDDGVVTGGLWAISLFGWMHVEMLLVPESMRGQGVGSALMALAETEAQVRGCLGMHVDTFSFQAGSFYEKMGFSRFGVLEDCPPGHARLFFQKRLVPKC